MRAKRVQQVFVEPESFEVSQKSSDRMIFTGRRFVIIELS